MSHARSAYSMSASVSAPAPATRTARGRPRWALPAALALALVAFLAVASLAIARSHAESTSASCSSSSSSSDAGSSASDACTRERDDRRLTAATMNPHVVRAEYAVRGKVLLRANDIDKRLRAGDASFPFREIVYCNIGNPQSLGQRPLTFPRRVQALLVAPELISSSNFPADVKERATRYLDMVKGAVGAYSDSQGVLGVRREVADFLERRDGIAGDPDLVFLTSGATQGVEFVMRALIRDSRDALLVPIPQYPLYSALTSLFDGHFEGYYLDEDDGWSLDLPELARALDGAKAKGKHPRALVVINPGNPTGNTISEEHMLAVARFCREHGLVLLADEVYQANVYAGRAFVSFRKVVLGLPPAERPQLVSFHSISKGVSGECGFRGGYFELLGFDEGVRAQLYKLASLGLCPNVVGQFGVALMVNPPRAGDPSFDQDQSERRAVFESLKRRAVKLVDALNKLEGVVAQRSEGAMYAFPRITLPARFVEHARSVGEKPDTLYVLNLLDKTGIVVVPGNGFGQREGTYHFRTTILPPEAVLDDVVARLAAFHEGFMREWK